MLGSVGAGLVVLLALGVLLVVPLVVDCALVVVSGAAGWVLVLVCVLLLV